MSDRREKNLRHLVTIISLIFCVGLLWVMAKWQLVDTWNIYATAVVYAFLLGGRTINVELGIRRRTSRRT